MCKHFKYINSCALFMSIPKISCVVDASVDTILLATPSYKFLTLLLMSIMQLCSCLIFNLMLIYMTITFLYMVPHGVISVTCYSGRQFVSVASHVCDEGYQPNATSTVRVCRDNGLWSGTTMVCGEYT